MKRRKLDPVTVGDMRTDAWGPYGPARATIVVRVRYTIVRQLAGRLDL